jgi:hypothetical protein
VLGSVRETGEVARWAGALLVALALGVWLRFQSVHVRLRAQEHQSRWASNLRDFINLACALPLAGAYWWTGLPFAAALLYAGTLGVVLDILRHTSLAGWRRHLASAGVLTFGLALTLFASPVLTASNRVATWLLLGR